MSALERRVTKLEGEAIKGDCVCKAPPIIVDVYHDRPDVLCDGGELPNGSCLVHPTRGRMIIGLRRFGTKNVNCPVDATPTLVTDGVDGSPVPRAAQE